MKQMLHSVNKCRFNNYYSKDVHMYVCLWKLHNLIFFQKYNKDTKPRFKFKKWFLFCFVCDGDGAIIMSWYRLTSKMVVALCLNKHKTAIQNIYHFKISSKYIFNSIIKQSGIGFIVDALFINFAIYIIYMP